MKAGFVQVTYLVILMYLVDVHSFLSVIGLYINNEHGCVIVKENYIM